MQLALAHSVLLVLQLGTYMKLIVYLTILICWQPLAEAFSVLDLESIREKYALPGVAAAHLQNNDVEILSTGRRKIDLPTPIENTDVFHLGSCTKAMTATLIAQLVEQKKLSWNSTLEELFPEVAMLTEFKTVTVAMLGAHRSGLTDEMIGFNNGQLWTRLVQMNNIPIEARRHATEQLLIQKPQATPNSMYHYSNWNYILLGAIIEKLSSLSWEENMQKNIFEPLKMNSCLFGSAVSNRTLPPQNPWPHRRTKNAAVALLPEELFDNPNFFGPAGTVSCSLGDWSIFAQAHLDGFNGKDTKILKADSFLPLHTAYPGQEYTSGGWLRLERSWAKGPALQHSGSNTLNTVNVWLAPKLNRGFMAATQIAGREAEKALNDVVTESMTDR